MKRNSSNIILLLCVWLAGGLGTAWAAFSPVKNTQFAPIQLDVRPTEDASLPYRGTLRVSPVAEEARDDAVLTVDGEVADGWSVAEPMFDSTQLADGWHEFTLQEGDESFTVRIWVLNDPKYVFHEGIVEEDETWGTEQVHLVHGWLSIPEGSQVVIADGAKVLYASETGYAGGREPSSQGSPIVMNLADLWLDGRTTVLETTSSEHEERLSVVEVTLQKRFVPEAGEIVGADTLASGSSRVYVFLITMAEGSRFVTVPEWSVEGENPEAASVDPAGNLTALYCERETEVELCATFAVDEESEPVTVRKTVVIQPSNIVPTTFELRKGWNLLACPFGRLTERSRADLLTRFQPYHYDADTQSYVMSDGMEYNDSIWLHADSDETIVLDLMTNQPE